MRILITFCTNKMMKAYALDLCWHWPFVVFENMTEMYSKGE